jgi:hypothetical protein
MRFEVLAELEMSLSFFLVVTLCVFACGSQGFGETYCPFLTAASILRVEAVGFSETLVSTYKSTCCHNPQYYRLLQRCENLNYHCLMQVCEVTVEKEL